MRPNNAIALERAKTESLLQEIKQNKQNNSKEPQDERTVGEVKVLVKDVHVCIQFNHNSINAFLMNSIRMAKRIMHPFKQKHLPIRLLQILMKPIMKMQKMHVPSQQKEKHHLKKNLVLKQH